MATQALKQPRLLDVPLLLDLCCGRGGWTLGFLREGWRCIGVDIADFSAIYPGRFIRADLLTWMGWRRLGPRLIVSSVPCEEFSRHGMPWTRARHPPEPSLLLWRRAEFIARELGVPLIQENVRFAEKWLGRSRLNCGPFCLWGDVPAIVPVFRGKSKQSWGGRDRAKRAMVPYELSRHIARCFNP